MTETTTGSRNLFFPRLGRLYDAFSRYSYDFIRFCVGAVLVPHGIQKLFMNGIGPTADAVGGPGSVPMPIASAYLAAAVQFLGGICLALGFFTRAAALAIWLLMTVSIVFIHWPNGYFSTGRGIEFPPLTWLMCIAFFFHGGGRHSVDRIVGKEI
jgi:putative oxidoreductase